LPPRVRCNDVVRPGSVPEASHGAAALARLPHDTSKAD